MEREESEKILNFSSKSEALFLELKKDILNGIIKPGDTLKQTELSVSYNISRIPVRDAIRKLESIGLIEIIKDRATVTSISLEKFKEVYEIRLMLEDYAMKKSAPEINEEKLKELNSIIKEMENLESDDLVKWIGLDRKLHFKIYENGKVPVLLRILTNLFNATNYTRLKYCEIPGKLKVAEDEHKELYEALQKKDINNSRSLIRKHIKNSLDTILKYKDKFFKF